MVDRVNRADLDGVSTPTLVSTEADAWFIRAAEATCSVDSQGDRRALSLRKQQHPQWWARCLFRADPLHGRLLLDRFGTTEYVIASLLHWRVEQDIWPNDAEMAEDRWAPHRCALEFILDGRWFQT